MPQHPGAGWSPELDCDVADDVQLLCLIGATNVDVAVLASPSTAE